MSGLLFGSPLTEGTSKVPDTNENASPDGGGLRTAPAQLVSGCCSSAWELELSELAAPDDTVEACDCDTTVLVYAGVVVPTPSDTTGVVSSAVGVGDGSSDTIVFVGDTDAVSAGDCAAGDCAAGDPAAGDCAAGDSAAGDSAAGDSAAGDSAAGDSAAGSVSAGELSDQFSPQSDEPPLCPPPIQGLSEP